MADGTLSVVPSVSVILPTYNRGYCLHRSIDSVLHQTFSDFELIIIDDGSTDDTRQIIESYDDSRIVHVHNDENLGQTKRLNEGLALARADLVAFQDSDDEWLPAKLEKQVTVMRSQPAKVGMVYTDKWRFEPDKEKFHWKSPSNMPEDGIVFDKALDEQVYNIGPQSVLIRRECFGKVGLFDERLTNFNDWDMFVRISKHYLLYHIKEPLVNYFVSADALTGLGEAKGIEAIEILFDKFLPDLRRNPMVLAKRAYWLGSYHMRAGHSSQGRLYLLTALKAHPLNARYAVAAMASLFGSRMYRGLHGLAK